MSKRPKRTQFFRKMLCFQQLTQLNLVIAVENTPTRASAFNLSDPAVVVNERAVTSRHRNEEYSSNPHPVSGSNNLTCAEQLTGDILEGFHIVSTFRNTGCALFRAVHNFKKNGNTFGYLYN